MDFSQTIMERQGHGIYEYIDQDLIPGLWLAYIRNPSDSGKIHHDVRERWIAGDEDVHEAMKTFANLTDLAR